MEYGIRFLGVFWEEESLGTGKGKGDSSNFSPGGVGWASGNSRKGRSCPATHGFLHGLKALHAHVHPP